MFEHSVRVPRHFKIAANIVQKVTEEGGSVKTLLYDSKLKHFRTSVLYALINESIKHAADIQKMFESTGILVNEPRLDPWLAKVLTAELIYGKKSLPSKSKPEQTILSYKERFEKFTPEVQDDQKSKVVRRPRYVRVNTNLLTTSDAIRAFQDDGYKFIRCTSGSYNDYLQQIQNLTEYDFTQDYHVKTIFVFPPGTKLHEHDLYLENKIILQDKATALAVHLLAAPPGSVVLDMCAAPGMKTTQLAAYLRNQGKIYAVERNEKRYETLCQYVEATESKCVETLLKDSLEIRRGDLDDVEYILLDPSCSGSGMELSVHNYIDETRLAKLTSLQEKFLKHAMNSFPNAKRIVYSTCSMFPEENERVVTNIVKASRAKWRVKDVKELLKDQWNNFGSGMYGSMGTRCLYAKPDTDLTIGFFLAVLDKDLRDNEKQQDDNNMANNHNKKDQKFKNKSTQNEDVNDVQIEQCETKNEIVEEKDLTKNYKEHTANPEVSGELNYENIPKTKKKKRNRDSKKFEIPVEEYEISESKEIPSDAIKIELNTTKKKKKKNKDKSFEICESSENNKSLEINDEIEISYKKNRKKRTNDSEAVTETEITITSDTEKINTPEINTSVEIETTKKKRKDRRKESLVAVKGTIIDISLDIETENASKESKKRKNQKDTSITSVSENEQLIISNNRETLESDKSFKDSNNVDKVEKTKKRKQKFHEDVVKDSISNTAEVDDSSCKTEKKSKKKHKHRESDTLETEEKKADIKDHELTANHSFEVPKNKKKKRDTEII
ncbi:28S rRNA (cytosine-C(5))-methyltransferase [Pararge aegeria]|nr:28S rRNA (cytosine-C(5))-methyltransferase [Pararge aegeria]